MTRSPLFETPQTFTVEAPAKILESTKFNSNFRATATRKSGIKAEDFLGLAQRFAAICTDVHGESDLQLILNQDVPVGLELIAASQGVYEGAEGTPLDLGAIDETAFSQIFDNANSMTLRIAPKIEQPDFRHSFSQVQWTHRRHHVLSFYAQDGGNYGLPANERPLQNTLTRKMFFVPDSAPKKGLKVELGIEADFKAMGPGRRQRRHSLSAALAGIGIEGFRR